MKLGVLASHEGTTLQFLIDECAKGNIGVEVAVVISNNSDSGALRRARAAGIPALHLSGRTHPDAESLDQAICNALQEHGVELVILAGYMKKIGPITLSKFPGRVLNTHPALLPKFGGVGMYGKFVHEAVLAAGEKCSGASVFVVTDEYDTGTVVGQCEVPVEPGDTVETLAARVQAAEKLLYADVIRGFLDNGCFSGRER